MSNQVFLLPDLGEGLTEADIAEWRVCVGDMVTIDQVVVEVETAKASVEVPVPFEGIVVAVHGAEGDTLHVGTPLITVGTADGDTEAGSDDSVAAAHNTYRTEERAGASGNVLIGYGTSEDSGRRRRRVARKGSPPPAASSPAAAGPAPSSVQPPHSVQTDEAINTGSTSPRVISPVVRKLARDGGLDLTTVSPTGRGGTIIRSDVERALAQPRPQITEPVGTTSAGDVRIPIKGLRKAVSEKLSTSRREIPDATTWVDVDATALVEARRAINAALPDDERISLFALLARLSLAALARFPELNATVDTANAEIVQFAHVCLGIAAQTPRGLVVPVVENADQLTTIELAREIQQATELAREGKLPPTRLTGGTFTLNNYGVFGVDGSTPIINHPEAAILGVGRIIDKPWVVDGELAVRKVTQISLSFDHRVCDGGTAGGFLRLFGDFIENPIAALGRL